MTTPTITSIGTASGLLLTDNGGKLHRINKSKVCEIEESTNVDVFRITIFCGSRTHDLEFVNQTEIDAFLADLDAQY